MQQRQPRQQQQQQRPGSSSSMDRHQILNEKQHQNLNNLFYDIGGRVSKYDDRLQQIVPAANQLETIHWHRALTRTQLVRASPVPLDRKPQCCCAAVLPPPESQNRTRIVCLLRALSLIWRSDTHALSSPHCAPNHFKLPNRIGRCC